MENSETHEQRLDLLVLARLWCAGEKPIKPGAVVTSLKAFSADALADAVNRSIDRLMSDQKIERIAPTKKGAKPEFKISPNGSANLRSRLGSLPATVPTFLAFSNSYLAAQATGLPVPMDAKSLKAFGKLLPAEICARHHHFAIPLDVGPDPARLALVKLALARSQDLPTDAIWLKKLPAGELPALVVAPLLGLKGTKASNLDKLLESEACRILNVSKPSQIRLGAIRLWLTGRSNDKPDALAEEKTNSFATEPAAKDFAVAVLTAARKAAHLDRRAVNNFGGSGADPLLLGTVLQRRRRNRHRCNIHRRNRHRRNIAA